MSKAKYKYNTQTLSYEKIEMTAKDRLFRLTTYVAAGLVFAALFIFISYTFIDSPKEKMLQRENEQLALQYKMLDNRINEIQDVLENIEERDNSIYREIFGAEPIPNSIRKSGIGGVNRYKKLEGYTNSDLVIEAFKKIDKLEKQLYIQSKSFDDVHKMALEKEKMLASIPAIQPVANKDLKRMASGYGYRIHPVYKTRKFHAGMDFTAPTGTEIYATGNGVIKEVKKSRRGWGNHVIIDHGYGYETVYGHMSAFNVRKGQKIKRGEVIGYVGNTGLSTAPHLHYEVLKNDKNLNPVNFYFNDLSPEEFDEMLHISSANNQSFD